MKARRRLGEEDSPTKSMGKLRAEMKKSAELNVI